MLYAAECGGIGLDTDVLQTCFSVFAEVKSMSQEQAREFMDTGDPWQPSCSLYRVARIEIGKLRPLLYTSCLIWQCYWS